jgi:hypothetical protein
MKSEDQAAASALSTVDETAATQLRVLATLQAVVDAAADDGLIRDLVVRFREERRAAFVRFHERTLDNGAGDLQGPSLERAYDEAIAFTIGLAGDGVEARALRERKQQALSSSAPPRPFFARFLEQQKR